MNNLETLKFDGSESYSDCTHTINSNCEVVFSITKRDCFYEVTVKAGTLGMCLQFGSMSRAQLWANYICFEMQLDGVYQSFARNEYAVKEYKGEVA